MDKENPTKAILIAGMHRSGTSALSRTLNLVGCAMSEVLVGGDQRGNERGTTQVVSSAVPSSG